MLVENITPSEQEPSRAKANGQQKAESCEHPSLQLFPASFFIFLPSIFLPFKTQGHLSLRFRLIKDLPAADSPIPR